MAFLCSKQDFVSDTWRILRNSPYTDLRPAPTSAGSDPSEANVHGLIELTLLWMTNQRARNSSRANLLCPKSEHLPPRLQILSFWEQGSKINLKHDRADLCSEKNSTLSSIDYNFILQRLAIGNSWPSLIFRQKRPLPLPGLFVRCRHRSTWCQFWWCSTLQWPRRPSRSSWCVRCRKTSSRRPPTWWCTRPSWRDSVDSRSSRKRFRIPGPKVSLQYKKKKLFDRANHTWAVDQHNIHKI